MKGTIYSIMLSLSCAAAAFGQTDDLVRIDGPVFNQSKGVQVFTVTSPYLGGQNAIEVLTPDKIEPGRKYRTLYVLPVEGGIGGKYGDGLAEVRKADAHNRYGLICVTMAFDTVPWYGAHASDTHIRHEEYIKKVVVPLVESRFPTTGKPDDRLLLGFSKSGWGAITLLLRNLDFFGAACSWDAPLMMTEQQMKFGTSKHFGTAAQMAQYLPTTLAVQQAAVLAKQKPRLTVLGHSIFGPDTKAFHQLLVTKGIPHRFDNSLLFPHDWRSGWVPKALAVFLEPEAHGGTP